MRKLRDGPLENLWGGGEVQKKYSRKGKLNKKKLKHALKNIHAMA